MNRIVSSICIIIILCCSHAKGYVESERFSIRNGITFGLSIEEVKSIEEKNGNANLLRIDNEDLINYWYLNIAGYEGCSVDYRFSNNALYEIDYCFSADGRNYTQTYALNTVKDLYISLQKKYGDAGHNGDGIVYSIISDVFGYTVYDKTGMHKLVAYAEWLLPYESDYMVIDLYVDSFGSTFSKTKTYTAYLNYRMVDKEKMEEIIQESQKNEDEKNARRNEDI